MTATSFNITTIYLANVGYGPGIGPLKAQTVDLGLSFSSFSQNITTLSGNSASSAIDVTGLLYVPELNNSDPCAFASAPFLPHNVTRRANLPDKPYYVVAIAPWINSSCTLNYLAAVSQDPIRGFVFFNPHGDSDSLPMSGSGHYDLGDGDRWKSHYHFPVYAISGAYGAELVRASSLYSGNLTQAPNGHQLSELYDPRGYVRLYVDIDTGTNPQIPTLWVFLLIVVGILIGIVALTSLTMHYTQRRRRLSLRRRIATGEVDLEALGIKRLTVPQQILDRMPLYMFGTGVPVSGSTNIRTSTKEPSVDDSVSRSTFTTPAPALVRTSTYQPSFLSQPTCAICLDDFVPGGANVVGTIVRELPCRHVFHPECIDIFLRDSSSLCPICKKTTLPKGYCPRVISNAMVRRERMLRRLRERVTVEHEMDEDDGVYDLDAGASASFTNRFRLHASPRFQSLSQHIEGSAPSERRDSIDRPLSPRDQGHTPSNALESSDVDGRNPNDSTAAQMRNETAKQRAVALLYPQAPLDPDAIEAQTSNWRKIARSIFPSSRL